MNRKPRVWVMPLSYAPKILPVKVGECFQSIRKLNQDMPKIIVDRVRFHTWADKPYRSKWDWLSPPLNIDDILRIMHDPFSGWYWASLVDYQGSGIFYHRAESKITDLELLGLAQMDFIRPPETLTDVIMGMHPEMRYGCIGFEVIRWDSRQIRKVT